MPALASRDSIIEHARLLTRRRVFYCMSMPLADRIWTVEAVRALADDGNRYEVIDGELFVTPAPSWTHQNAVLKMYRMLAGYLDREPYGHPMLAPADVAFSRTRSVQPDLFVVPLVGAARPPHHFDEVRRLLLVVEVLSPTTARADRVAKRVLFREEGVAEYWVIDLDARAVERSTRPIRESRLSRIDSSGMFRGHRRGS
jgi:Uma2 family endonuclease